MNKKLLETRIFDLEKMNKEMFQSSQMNLTTTQKELQDNQEIYKSLAK